MSAFRISPRSCLRVPFRKCRCLLFVCAISLGLRFGYQLLIKQESAKLLPSHTHLYPSDNTQEDKSLTKAKSLLQATETDLRLQISHYLAKFNSTLIGKKLKFDKKTLAIVENVLRDQTFKRKPVESVDAKTPFFDLVVPVTGISSNHYEEFMGNIEDFLKQFPGVKWVFYDIGLNDFQAKEMKLLPNIVYRKFDFDSYPSHIRKLHTKAWKILIWQEMLAEFDATMWLDASIKFRGNQTHVLMEKLARRKTGFMSYIDATHHSILSATHPGMMEYFPMEKAGALKNMLQSGADIFINKDEVQTHVMKWLVVCALKSDCIEPPGVKRYCRFYFPKDKFGGCHRYDQSILNILVGNMYNHKQERYHYASDSFAVVKRG